MKAFAYWGLAIAAAMDAVFAADPPVNVHTLTSPYQNGEHAVRVVVPDDYDPVDSKRYRTLYILPVERGFEEKFGSGLKILTEFDAHNRYGLVLVRPAFEKVPWFGDHASDPKVRQADYLKKAVVPFIEKNYRTTGDAAGRLLIGFSKSGWGAFSLILRDPDFWGYAGAWDSPMMLDRQMFGTDQVFGTQEQLDRYRPDLLVRKPEVAEPFQKRKRLVLTGEKFWGVFPKLPTPGGGSHTAEFHDLLEELEILHRHDASLTVPHRWDRAVAGIDSGNVDGVGW